MINQHQIKTKDLKKAYQALVEFAHEFEVLYYQLLGDDRMTSWVLSLTNE